MKENTSLSFIHSYLFNQVMSVYLVLCVVRGLYARVIRFMRDYNDLCADNPFYARYRRFMRNSPTLAFCIASLLVDQDDFTGAFAASVFPYVHPSSPPVFQSA